MSRIKSALELAMENTSQIEIDPRAVIRNEVQKMAKRNCSLFLDGEREELVPSDIEEKETYLSVLKEALLTNLKLPLVNEDLARVPRLESAFCQLALTGEGKKGLTSLFGQLKNFFAQYLDSREQLQEGLAAQYEPQLRQKEELYRERTGQNITLRPEQDPEFLKLLNDRQKHMDAQYNEVIKQAKDQIRELL